MNAHAAAQSALRALSKAATTLTWATPQDLPRHRAALLHHLHAGDEEYPTPWSYPDVDTGTVRALAETALHATRHIASPLAVPATAMIEQILTHVEVLKRRDDAELTRWEHAHHGVPTRFDIAQAQEILASTIHDEAETPTVDSESAARHMQHALDHHCDGWAVEINAEMAAGASVVGARSVVKVRAGQLLTVAQVNRLTVHEIGGHVLRWVNSSHQPEPLASIPLVNAIATEEGLAALLEEQLGVSSATQGRIYASRTLAVDLAQHEPVLSVARHLAPHVGPEKAIDIAIRTKRGLLDPNNPGGPTNDAAYLKGLLHLRRLATDDPAAVTLLRATKWPWELLPLMRELTDQGTLHGPTVLPDADHLRMPETT